MAAMQLKKTRYMLRVMDETLYAVYMPKFLRNDKILFKTFIQINKDIIYVDSERHR